MSYAADQYIAKLIDERNRVQNLANTCTVQLSRGNLTEHERLEVYAVLGKLNSELGQFEAHITNYRQDMSRPVWERLSTI